MQHAFRLLLVSAVLTLPVFGAPCVSGNLQQYIGLGATGCTVNGAFSNLLLSDFTDQSGSVSAGATAIDPLSVSVTPLLGGLRFSTSQVVSNGILESFLRFTASNAQYAGVTLTLSGASATGDAAVNGIFDGCTPGTFDVPGGICSGTQISLAVTQLDGFAALTDTRTFSRQNLVDAFVSLSLDSGSAGIASGATLDVTFADVPEPATSALLFAGAAGLLLVRRLRTAR